jgi:3-oxoacyl-[acyl-carrier-protein] synthase III
MQMIAGLRAAITAVACFLPDERLTNADLAKTFSTTEEWIFERSGIQERRVLRDPNKGSAYLASQAAKELLSKSQLDPATVDLLIVATATPEYQYPATANIVSNWVGMKHSWSFDLMGTCSGFIFALNVARMFIECGVHERVVVIGSDKMSTIVDYTDRNTSILFGDGAGAVLLEPDGAGAGILDARMYTDGSGAKEIYQIAGGSFRPASIETTRLRQHFVHMNGRAVFKVAVEKMADVAEEMMTRNRLSAEDLAFLVPHQANKRIIDATARRLGIGENKVMANLQRYGNTTTATIPICLAEWENRLKRGDNLVLVTFGAGFTWGGIYLKWAYDSPRPV